MRCTMMPGLDDVVAAETTLSHVDGAAGRLIVRGFDLEQLAGKRSLRRCWDCCGTDLRPGRQMKRACAARWVRRAGQRSRWHGRYWN